METNKPYVSVVMTSYNRAHYIEQAILSIINQERNFPIEIIIGDDCSTDNSSEILTNLQKQYPDIIVLNLQKSNQGLGRNWASTLKLAKGKYVAFLDDDDYWTEHHLLDMVEYMDFHDECGLVYTNRWILDVKQNKKTLANVSIPDYVNKVDYLDVHGFPILFSATMIRKSEIDAHVNLDDYIRLDIPIQDWPTAMLLAPYSDFHYIDCPSVVYRSYAGSMSKPREYDIIVNKYAKEKRMNRYVQEQLGRPFDEEGWDRYVNHLLMSLAVKRGEYSKAKKYAKLRGGYAVKTICCRTWLSFQIWRLAKAFRKSLNHKNKP